MTEIILRKRAARAGEIGLFPVDEQGVEVVGKIREGRDVGADVIQRRNPRHHRLYFAILQFAKMHAVDENGNALFSQHTDPELISTAVKIGTGYVRTFIDHSTGKTVMVPKSIAWAAMDQTEFGPFFDRACEIIASRWMPLGTTTEDVRQELIRMVDGEHAIGERASWSAAS